VPRDLVDVLDYLLPPAGDRPPHRAEQQSDRTASGGPSPPDPHAGDAAASASFADQPRSAEHQPFGRSRASRPAALPIVSLPIADRDVVRAAFGWNLAVEIARLGGSATLVAPAGLTESLPWPADRRGPMGAQLERVQASDLGELNRAALDVAVSRTADSADGGIVLVRVPPGWMTHATGGRALLRWVLLFSSTEARDLREAYALAKRIVRVGEQTRVGVTIHGARRLRDAEHAFSRISSTALQHLRHSLVSYGLLVDDLHIYRASVAHRPIGLEHPQSRAARALRDVARLLLDDARNIPVV